ncbi:uncharacterized protein METZ01_LOCUS23546 [marine metagenome]|uniref:Uncharacterized protein n=1 Tax=marine metagenome TaxID=408172 RepID=A0A381PUF7_9ZZZZ
MMKLNTRAAMAAVAALKVIYSNRLKAEKESFKGVSSS